MSNKFALSDIKEYAQDMTADNSKNAEISSSASPIPSNDIQLNVRDQADSDAAPLPARAESITGLAGSGTLDRLAETARDYAKASTAENTNKAYATDWAHFTRWCHRHGAQPLAPPCPDPQIIGLYLTELAAPTTAAKALSYSTIERRLSGLAWNYVQRGFSLDRKNRHIASVLAGIKRKHGQPPRQKAAIGPADILAMVATLPHELRGLRDRSILLVGYAGGFRRSELVALDVNRDDTDDGRGWIETSKQGTLVTLQGKTGWREIAIGRGSSDQTCPVHALEKWLHFAKKDWGPVFTRTSRDGKAALDARLNDKHVARLIKQTVLTAGLRSDLPEKERLALYSGHSLRAGLATSAQADERDVQRQLGHASADMTRRYQRDRDRFRVNLTKAAGL